MKKIFSRAYLPLLRRPRAFLEEHLHRALEEHQAKRGYRKCGGACIQSEDKNALLAASESKQFTILSSNSSATGVPSKEKKYFMAYGITEQVSMTDCGFFSRNRQTRTP